MKALEKNIAAKSKTNSNKVFFQPKLTINPPDDQYEREADSVADQVMRMPFNKNENNFFNTSLVNYIQRQCAECEEEEKMQRKENSNSEVKASNSLESYVGSIKSGGNALPDSVRRFFEPRIGFDFSNVRIHNDSVAAKSAQSINALAYTSGNNIVFNEDKYSPDTDSGKKLLAHELTHVVQQNGNSGIQRKTYLGNEGIADATIIGKASKVKTIVLDTLKLQKSSLYPFVKDKLTVLEDKFKKEFIFDPAVFGYKYKKLNDIQDQSIKEKDVHKTIGGFVNPKTNDIFLHNRSNYCHAFHEALHAISYHRALRSNFGTDIMEGLTQYFTDVIFTEQTGKACKTHNYGSQLKCASKAVTTLGGFSNAAEIFFNAKFNIVNDIAKTKSIGVMDFMKSIKQC
ncbi:MAG: DUF4157 domain-containing protein [Ignavibacteria bacterium]|nr:DUF4157 domain-containing protein [Ignavibacteria bacterium]